MDEGVQCDICNRLFIGKHRIKEYWRHYYFAEGHWYDKQKEQEIVCV